MKLSIGFLLGGTVFRIVAAQNASVPACQLSAAPPEKNLTTVRTANVTLPAQSNPFGLAYAHQKDIAFVALDQSLGVLNISTFTPELLYEIPLNNTGVASAFPAGLALTHDGRYLLIAANTIAAIVVDTATAAIGEPNAVVGILNGSSTAGKTSIEVTVTPDDQYAFVSEEYGSSTTDDRGTIEVFQLNYSTNTSNFSSTYVGYLALDFLVVGSALSPDGSILYATSEQTEGYDLDSSPGTLSLIDVETLKTDPSNALLSRVDSGCGAVRVIVSQDGDVVWVTARESNSLVAFDAAKLKSNSSNPVLTSFQVGNAPVGLTFAQNESLILTANSNRFGYPNATTGISMVNVSAALDGGQAVFGQIATGIFPREIVASPDGSTILCSDYSSNQVQAIDVYSLP